MSYEAPKSRMLLALNYEDVSDDPMRNDKRWTGSLAFSRKVADDYWATATLVYADRPEFRGDVDHEISARVGLNFQIDRKQD